MSFNPAYDDNGDPYNVMMGSIALTDADAAEWSKMQTYTPAPADNVAPWWQNLVSYGVSKAIDNSFPGDAYSIQGNTRPGSFAGQNGSTYNQRGSSASAPTLASGWLTRPSAGAGGLSPLMLILGGLLVLHLVK